MNILTVQIVVALVMLVLFFITFKLDKTKITVKEMAIITLLCVITAILSKTLSIKFPPGQPIFVISFASAVAITIGLLFPPRLALIAGLIIDLIGLMLAPASGDNSMPFLGFTLTAMLSCFIPAILVKLTKTKTALFINIVTIMIIIVSLISASFYLFSVDSISIDKTANDLTDQLRYTIIAVLVVISCVVLFINNYLIKKIQTNDASFLTTSHITMIVLVEQLICSIILTSLWINIMYGVPLVPAAISRMIKMLLQLPINVFIIYFILKYIPSSYKKNLY